MSALVLFTYIQMKLNYPGELAKGRFQIHELMQMVRLHHLGISCKLWRIENRQSRQNSSMACIIYENEIPALVF